MKAASRRWPFHVFYNVIDLALINSWTFFRDRLICKCSISREKFIQREVEELIGAPPGYDTRKDAAARKQLTEADNSDKPPEKKRKI